MIFCHLLTFSKLFFFKSFFQEHYQSVRVATVRENILENKKKIQVREKSGNFIFSQGNLEKMKKVMEKSGKIKVFPKKLLVNGLLEILSSINCKQY